jgi:hypothetical protein
MNNESVVNTDKEIWREKPNDYYSPYIFVTEQNSIGISVGGWVYVKPVEDWHKLAEPAKTLTDEEIIEVWSVLEDTNSAEHDAKVFARAILKKAQEK